MGEGHGQGVAVGHEELRDLGAEGAPGVAELGERGLDAPFAELLGAFRRARGERGRGRGGPGRLRSPEVAWGRCRPRVAMTTARRGPQPASSTHTGAWSLGRSFLRGALSIWQAVTAPRSAVLTSTWSMRRKLRCGRSEWPWV